jgi:hypothetical protein
MSTAIVILPYSKSEYVFGSEYNFLPLPCISSAGTYQYLTIHTSTFQSNSQHQKI